MLGLSLALTPGNQALAGAYTQRWVQFANESFTNTTGATYLEKTGTFTGAPANATAFSYVAYFQHYSATTTPPWAGVAVPQHIFAILGLSTDTVTVINTFVHNAAATSGVSRARSVGDGGSPLFQRDSAVSQVTATASGPIMLMCSGTRAGTISMYVGDTSVGSGVTWTDTEDMLLTQNTKARVAASGDSVRPFTGKLGLIWFDDSDLDFTQESSRRLFWDGSGPVRPPSGALVHLGGEKTAANWGTNQGTGGDFTIVNSGGLTDV